MFNKKHDDSNNESLKKSIDIALEKIQAFNTESLKKLQEAREEVTQYLTQLRKEKESLPPSLKNIDEAKVNEIVRGTKMRYFQLKLDNSICFNDLRKIVGEKIILLPGTSTVYKTKNSFSKGSLAVYFDGLRLTEGIESDYITHENNLILFNFVPIIKSNIVVDYMY